MWSWVRVVIGVLAVLSASGCNLVTEQRYYREGIGPDLNWSGQAEATAFQDQYLELLCRQAAPRTRVPEECATILFGPEIWPLIVQAGMNDIDQRCDAFLNWVDYHRRNDKHLIKQVSDTIIATTSILTAVNASAKAMDIVAAALGFASNTFANMTARLLTIADGTTVQSVVLAGQNRYRIEIRDLRIDNRPAAIHALRSYLRICMPFTIETRINSTVTIYEQSGPRALEEREQTPLIDPRTVAPVTAREPIRVVERPERPINESYKLFIENYDPNTHGERGVRRVLDALCFRAPTIEKNNITRLVRIYQQRYYQNDPNPHITGLLSPTREFIFLRGLQPCPTEFKNYYERKWEGYEKDVDKLRDLQSFVKQLNAVPDGGRISEAATFRSDSTALRNKIRAVNKYYTLPSNDEVTIDLIEKLPELPRQ